MYNIPDWAMSLPCAITVSDINNKIIYMNDRSAETWKNNGGKDLIGKDLFACHNAMSKEKISKMLESGGQNIYTVEKQGIKKLIFQSAWKDENEKPAGMVEISIVLPLEIKHIVRS